jgi:hypothetical protein
MTGRDLGRGLLTIARSVITERLGLSKFNFVLSRAQQ